MKRRDFITKLGLFSSSLSLNLAGLSFRSVANPIFYQTSSSNKILVLVQLFGGNDGLNTLVPFEDDYYYKNRPNISLKPNEIHKIGNGLGFHPTMQALKELFMDGKVSIIQNVGYENPDRSHFRSTDIWNSASESEEYLYTGWVGRSFEGLYSEGLNNISYPSAIELGWSGSLLLENHSHNYGLFMNSIEEYLSIYQDIPSQEEGAVSLAGQELKYLNSIAMKSNKFSLKVKDAVTKGKNKVEYPKSFLGNQLSAVARLISGELETSIYLTKLKGFDTHVNQLIPHSALLSQVSEAISAFQKDIEALGIADNVTILIYSEFGRRLKEGALGTDHGTAAPIFVIGNTVNGGIIGKNANLGDLDNNGDLKYKYDYRQIYSSILSDHLGTEPAFVNNVLNKTYSTLPIFKNSREILPKNDFELLNIYPNPLTITTTIQYKLLEKSTVELYLLNEAGSLLSRLFKTDQLSGSYNFVFDSKNLPQGIYFLNLKVNGKSRSKKIIKI